MPDFRPSPLLSRNLGRLDWDSAARIQEETARALARGVGRETLLFVEHEPVYTYGLRFRPRDFLRARNNVGDTYCGVPVRRAWRGGGVTYHGPGQLVVYPILRLRRGGPGLRQLVAFYRETVIAVLSHLGIEAWGLPDAVGVWTARGKIASIGVGLKHGITRNGFAVNVEVDRSAFEAIVPCERRGEAVANVNDHLGRRISVDEMRCLVEKEFIRSWGTVFAPAEVRTK